MADLLLSDDDFARLRETPKRVQNPKARWREKSRNQRQRTFNATADDGTRFHIYMRLNARDERDFSCGLALVQRGGRTLPLVRYNGSNHIHGSLRFCCHIHHATADAYNAGGKIDSCAEATNRYTTLEGAFACLIKDCAIQGVSVSFGKRGSSDDS